MHILIPYANAGGPRCTRALDSLDLPQLRAISKVCVATSLRADPGTLTPLHERLHAQALGLPAPDGLVPWAAWQAQQLGLPAASGTGWARLTLCHWTINADHVAMSDPQTLQVTNGESAALMEAMRGFFAEDGITLYATNGPDWLASGNLFMDLPTASLQRACGNQIDAWMPRQPQAKPLRRLQNEMQMLLYTHPINDARAQQRRPAINSFWVSQTGGLPDALPVQSAEVHYVESLRHAALHDDDRAWVEAWHHIDNTVLARFLDDAKPDGTWRLTLCGSASAQTFAAQPQGWWTRVKNRFSTPDIPALLKSL